MKCFTVVRNPYTRVVSALFFHKLITDVSSQEDVYKILQTFITRRDLHNHNLPHYFFISDENGNLYEHITILRTETLKDDMIQYGYTDFNCYENKNRKKTKDYMSYLNEDSIRLINDFYDRDFLLFNYTKIAV
jgi:hypothetical protein